MSQAELRQLLQVLQDRDIPLGEDDIAWAFENPKLRSQLSLWINTYLSTRTLLTKDEFKFLESNGGIEPSGKLAMSRGLSEFEIEAAIASIESSTAAIERQTKVLTAQKNALQELRSRNMSGKEPDSDDLVFERRILRDQAQAGLEVDEVYQAMDSLIDTGLKQVNVISSKIRPNVERVLERDDRLFGGIQKLLPKLADLVTAGDDAAEIEEMCSALSIISVKEIHAQLDATYRSTLYTLSGTPNETSAQEHSTEQLKQREHLRTELDELGNEIEGLVTMAINNQYRKPLIRSMKASQAENLIQKTQWADYTITTVQYLAARLEILNEHIQHIHGHHAALRAIKGTLEHVIGSPSRGTQRAGSTRATDMAQAKGLKPLRLVQANLSEAQDPTIQLLRQLDVRLSDSSNSSNLTDILRSAVKEREDRMSQFTKDNEGIDTDNIASSLARADTHVQDLLRAVFSSSKYLEIKLVDDDVQAALDQLEVETQVLGDGMRILDIDEMTRVLKSKQAAMVERLTS